MSRLSFAAIAFVVAFSGATSAQSADTVLFGGKVVTVDRDFSVREAIAIADGRVHCLPVRESGTSRGRAVPHVRTLWSKGLIFRPFC